MVSLPRLPIPFRAPETDLSGWTAAITGAGSGIGRGLAQELARHGCRLSLADIDSAGLAETVSLLPVGTDVLTAVVDVAAREQIEDWAEQTVAEYGGVDLVINNAGIAHVATVSSMEYEALERVWAVNAMGVVFGTKAFLPLLSQSPHGHLVNIASIFGMIAVPTQSAYNMSKFAVRGFTEALASELAMVQSPVSVHLVLPGGIDTNIARRATSGETEGIVDAAHLGKNFESLASTSPEQAAARIVRGVRRGEQRILVGRDAQALDLLVRAMPSRYQWLVQRGMKL